MVGQSLTLLPHSMKVLFPQRRECNCDRVNLCKPCDELSTCPVHAGMSSCLCAAKAKHALSFFFFTTNCSYGILKSKTIINHWFNETYSNFSSLV